RRPASGYGVCPATSRRHGCGWRVHAQSYARWLWHRCGGGSLIRYAITEAELNAKIDALDPNWRAKAACRTDRFRRAGRFTERTNESIWGDIKDVYLHLQYSKCAYCERKLEGPPFGAIEHDV